MDNTEVVLDIDIKNALNQIESLANTVQKLTNALTSIIDKMDEVKNASDKVGSSMKKQKQMQGIITCGKRLLKLQPVMLRRKLCL